MIPEWLNRSDGEDASVLPLGFGHSRGIRFLDRTSSSFARFAGDFLSADRADEAGLLQSIHPSAKLVSMLLLIIVSTFLHELVFVCALIFVAFALAAVSRVSLSGMAWKTCLLVLPFTGMIAIPAIFNFITPGDPLVVIARLGRPVVFGPWLVPADLAISSQGVQAALMLVARAAASVSLLSVLLATTGWNSILHSLAAFKLPSVFVMILGMTYRYILVMIKNAEEMYMARKSRTIHPGNVRWERRWIASRMGFLARKSMEMGDDIHRAMISRGFSGEPRFAPGRAPALRDFIFTVSSIIFAAMLLIADRF
jgi:cobalt/nickel transport system permease protein